MKQTLHVVALRTVRHNERHNIFTGYSLESGRVAMAVTAGAGKSASRLRALLMPLSIIECEADMRPGRDIHTMSGVRAVVALHGIHAHPMKSAVAMVKYSNNNILNQAGTAMLAQSNQANQSVLSLLG